MKKVLQKCKCGCTRSIYLENGILYLDDRLVEFTEVITRISDGSDIPVPLINGRWTMISIDPKVMDVFNSEPYQAWLEDLR